MIGLPRRSRGSPLTSVRSSNKPLCHSERPFIRCRGNILRSLIPQELQVSSTVTFRGASRRAALVKELNALL